MLPTFEKLRTIEQDSRAKQSVSGSSPSQPPKPTWTGRHTESSPKAITPAQQYQSNGPNDGGCIEGKDAEEPGDDYAFEDATSPMRKIRQWFILLTQWTQLVSELQTFLPRVCRDPERPLRIRAGYTAQAVQPRHQESLFNTIGNVLPKLPLEEKLAAIKRVISNKTIQTNSLNVLRGVTEDHDPEEWQEAFDGGIHCEAQLIQDYGSNLPFRTIGISKRCCFCCEALLSSYGLSTNTHGKIYAWACPPGLPENTQRLILDRLEAQLERFFQTVAPRTQTPESAPDTARKNMSFVDVEEVDNYDLESDEGDVNEA
ncbi:hypothetical protein FRC04_010262 [Tulasnella sp. 424]|nr:hypothetical protein FRC04_010262 [Tulasnella sp. 424]